MSEFNICDTRFELYVGLRTRSGRVLDYETVLVGHIEPAMFHAGVPGFSVEEITGYWEGVREQTARVTLFTQGEGLAGALAAVSARLAEELDQDAILLVSSPAVGHLISRN